MLVYHQAFDLYHGIYRMMILLSVMQKESIEVDKLRIWDFFFVFPDEVAYKLRFTNDINDLRSIFKKRYNPYESLTNSERVFHRMKGFQISALKCLASYGYINSEELNKNLVTRTSKSLPKNILSSDLSIMENNVIKLFLSPFNDLPFNGESGFKDRTGLLEFKYDPKH